MEGYKGTLAPQYFKESAPMVSAGVRYYCAC